VALDDDRANDDAEICFSVKPDIAKSTCVDQRLLDVIEDSLTRVDPSSSSLFKPIEQLHASELRCTCH
jgi:hypothetical protein